MSKGEILIVLVEDNPSDAELTIRALRKNNLANRIVHLKDGEEAIEFLFGKHAPAIDANDAPRVVLLDIKLPKVDGIEILRRMKSDERTRNMPVVVLTSSNQEQDIRAAYDLGVNSFVTKPIRYDDFARVVTELGAYWLMLNVPPTADE